MACMVESVHQMERRRLPALEGLRALGTIGIFLFHSGFLFQGTFPVTLFFMLSGFLLYYRKAGRSGDVTFASWIKGYVWKKWRKFYPLHLITFLIAVALVLRKSIWTRELTVSGLLQLLLIHPFFPKYALSHNGLSWFLAVTMFLYVIAFFLLKLIDNVHKTKGCIAFTLGIIVLLSLLSRKGISLYLYTNPLYRILDFWLGMLIAKAYLGRVAEVKNATKTEFLLVVIFFVQYALSLLIGETPGYYSVLFAVALYVFAIGEGVVSKIISGKVFRIIAYYSFEFYMIHELALRIFRRVFPDETMPYLLRCTIIAIPALVVSAVFTLVYKQITEKKSKI